MNAMSIWNGRSMFLNPHFLFYLQFSAVMSSLQSFISSFLQLCHLYRYVIVTLKYTPVTFLSFFYLFFFINLINVFELFTFLSSSVISQLNHHFSKEDL